MSWFDEQIRTRKESDQNILHSAYFEMAKSILGDKASYTMSDDMVAKNAVEEILKYYHIEQTSCPDNVTSVEDKLEFYMHPYGYMRRRVELMGDWYKDANGPMLAAFSDGTPVAIVPGKFGGYYFKDKGNGTNVKVNKDTAKLISKNAFAFYKPFPNKELNVADLIKYMLSLVTRMDIVLILVSYVIVTMCGLLTPKFTSLLVGKVIEYESYQLLFAVSVFMLCTAVSNALVTVYQTLIMDRLNLRVTFNVEAATMMRILSLPTSFFKKYSAGELSNISSYVTSLCSSIMSTLLSSSLQAVFSLAYIGSVMTYAPSLLVPAIIFLIITIGFSILSTLMKMGITEKQMKVESEVSGLEFGLITGVEKIKLAGAEKRAFAKWANVFAKQASYAYNPPLLIKINTVISLIISSVQTVVMYYITIANGVTLSEYSAFNAAFATMSGAFTGLLSMAITVANIKPILKLVEPILECQPEIAETKNVISKVTGNIRIENASFRYSEETPLILDDFTLNIKPGQYVAIVGKTGCGKSTLVRLLLGFEKLNKGAIYYDNKDINSIDLKSLRKNIGVVLQDGKVFTGDIFSNIIISAPQLTLEDAWEAAEIAGFADDIRQMPMGMSTMISEGMGGISGGQKQRLIIARAIAPKPKILIFDEATSALDNVTQKKVSDALDSMGCTRIVIAHRLSTIKHCDRIVVLDGGRIIEDGTYDELIEANGFFKDLVERQRV